jgi:hypothetical protein
MEALDELGNASPEVLSCLLSLLGKETSYVRYRVVSVLSHLAKTSDTICPEVVQWLEQNPNNHGVGDAIDCLWSIVVE